MTTAFLRLPAIFFTPFSETLGKQCLRALSSPSLAMTLESDLTSILNKSFVSKPLPEPLIFISCLRFPKSAIQAALLFLLAVALLSALPVILNPLRYTFKLLPYQHFKQLWYPFSVQNKVFIYYELQVTLYCHFHDE